SHDVEQVGRGHLGQRRVKPFTAEGRLRHCQRGAQQSRLADACLTAIPLDLVRLQGQDLVQRQEDRLHCASRLKTPAYLRCARSTTLRSFADRAREGTGETTSTLPSVETSSSVSASMLAS